MNPIHENRISLNGRLTEDIRAIKTHDGRTVYNTYVMVNRQSGEADTLPVSFEKTAALCDPYGLRGKRVHIEGEVRSINREDEASGHRHIAAIWAHGIKETDSHDGQSVRMEGNICSQPRYRKTPKGKEICDMILAVCTGGKASYIPVIAWGSNARKMAEASTGDVVSLTGRFQSRVYRKKLDAFDAVVERMAYEVSAQKIDVIISRRKLVAQ